MAEWEAARFSETRSEAPADTNRALPVMAGPAIAILGAILHLR